MITVSIELDKIPKEQIVEKNGKKYLNIVVDTRKEVDRFGNTHSVYMSQSKEQRNAKEPKVFIGNGKEWNFNNIPQQAVNYGTPTLVQPDNSNLPF